MQAARGALTLSAASLGSRLRNSRSFFTEASLWDSFCFSQSCGQTLLRPCLSLPYSQGKADSRANGDSWSPPRTLSG